MGIKSRLFVSAAAGLALVGAAVVAPAAQAAPLGHPLSVGSASAGHVENVRWRGGGGGWHGGGGWRGGYGHRGYGYRGWGAAPFVGGLAAGAIVGSAFAYPRYYAPYPGNYADNYDYDTYADNYAGDGDAGAYCAQRFKSYDPRSGTYLGYDGQRHPCP